MQTKHPLVKRIGLSSRTLIPFLSGMLVTIALVIPTLTIAKSDSKNAVYRQLGLFGDIFQRIRESYVDKVDEKKLIEAAINGMLTSLDPHSSFLNSENFSAMKVQTKGKSLGCPSRASRKRIF